MMTERWEAAEHGMPVTNPELIKIMNEFLKEKSVENEVVLIEKIRQAHFLTPIKIEGEVENGEIKAGTIGP